MNRTFVGLGAAFGFVAVALGAFGAHALRDRIDAGAMAVYQTAVQYQAMHALALLFVGLLASRDAPRSLRWSGWLFTAGILIFSGSLVAMALTGIKVLGAITPIGGVCFLFGWVALAVASRSLEPTAQR